MRFSPQFLDELRARLPVSEVVGRRVKLRKAGREWKGLSPFNKEKTPSFFVNDQKMAWFDFSSGKNGNIFDFVMVTEGRVVPRGGRAARGAGRHAAAEGVARGGGARPAPQDAPRRDRAGREILRGDARVARSAPRRAAISPIAASIRRRSSSSASAMRRPSASRSRSISARQGVPVEDMVEAGLLVAGDDIPVPYDRFRDRVMFPITDLRGRVIAFGGRALEKDVPAKYLNSPETPLFHKGATLYNIAAARVAAHKRRAHASIAVEGYVDVIAMVSAGLRGDGRAARHRADRRPARAAVEDGRRADPLLRRRRRRPARRLSRGRSRAAADRAGQEPALREPARRPGPRRPRARGRPRGGGRGARRARGRSPQVLWMRETEAGGFDTPERRAALEARLGEVTAAIGDETVRRYYRREFGDRLRRLFEATSGRRRRPKQGRSDPRGRRAWPQRAGHGARPQHAGSCRRARAAGRRRALRGGEPAAGGEPGASRPPRRHSAPRGADPAGRPQPSLACSTTIWRSSPSSSSAMPRPRR